MLIWQLILIQVVTFALIVLFLRWLLYSQISRALTKLHKLNKQNLAKEKVLNEELARAKKQVEREIARGKAEAKALKKKLKMESEEEATRILENARRRAKGIINESIKESQRKANDLTAKMEEKTVYLAVDIIKYIFTQASQKNLQNQLIDELIDEINSIGPEKLKVENHSIDIITAFDLDDKQKARIKEILALKLGEEISLTNHLDESIIAGVILKSGGFVVDGSIKNKLKKILPIIKERARS